MSFFDHFLKNKGDWLTTQPPVLTQIRHVGNRFVERGEDSWPLPGTRWTNFLLDRAMVLCPTIPPAVQAATTYQGLGEGVTFRAPVWDHDVEITGCVAAKLFVFSSTRGRGPVPHPSTL